MSFTLKHFYQQSKEKYKLKFITPSVTLNHKITWIHLLEDINNCSFIRGGELIITTGLNAGEEDLLFDLASKIYASGASGLILNVGNYIHHIPDSLISWCSQHDFPLFTMPWEIHIADLMQDYCNQIISEERTQERRNSALLQCLTSENDTAFQTLCPDFASGCAVASDHELSIDCYAFVLYETTYYYLCSDIDGFIFDRHCGVSNLTEAPLHLSLILKQAYRSMQVSKIKNTEVSFFKDIGLYYAALAIDDLDVLYQAERLLSPLQDEDIRSTFRLYLEYNGSVQATAQALFLHRNTVNYRIQKARRLLQTYSAEKELEYLFSFYLCDCLKLKEQDLLTP